MTWPINSGFIIGLRLRWMAARCCSDERRVLALIAFGSSNGKATNAADSVQGSSMEARLLNEPKSGGIARRDRGD